MRVTPCASFDGNGYANANTKIDTFFTTSKKYSLPAFDVLGHLCKCVTSSTSQGSKKSTSSMAIRWVRGRFLLVHPHDKTCSRVSLHISGQWNLSRSSVKVRATPGCPCWQRTKGSRPDTKPRSIADTDVSWSNIKTSSHSSHSRCWPSTWKYQIIMYFDICQPLSRSSSPLTANISPDLAQ